MFLFQTSKRQKIQMKREMFNSRTKLQMFHFQTNKRQKALIKRETFWLKWQMFHFQTSRRQKSQIKRETFTYWPKLQMFHFETSQRQKGKIKRPSHFKGCKVFNVLRSSLSFEGTCICYCRFICRNLQLLTVVKTQEPAKKESFTTLKMSLCEMN